MFCDIIESGVEEMFEIVLKNLKGEDVIVTVTDRLTRIEFSNVLDALTELFLGEDVSN